MDHAFGVTKLLPRLPWQLRGKESTWNAGDAVWSLGWEDALEIATQSSIHAWEIPLTEEPGRLQSMGRKGVKHDIVSKQQQKQFQNHWLQMTLTFIQINFKHLNNLQV